MRRLLRLKLKIWSKLILRRYQPIIIGITGSIGKTSAKDAIVRVLEGKISSRASSKNYNNEIGVPLTIIGVDSPGKNIFGWINVGLKAIKLILKKDEKYPRVLILEMGVDRPGDLNYLTNIAPVNVALVTAVSYSHLEYFGSLNNIKKDLIDKI